MKPLHLASLFALGASLSLQPLTSHAASLSWINAAGGFAGAAGNWNPAQVPAAADNLSFGLNNIYTVTFGSGVPATNQLSVNAGTIKFRFPTPHTTSSVLAIAQSGALADLTIDSGTFTTLNNIYMAAPAGNQGTLTVTGAGTSVAAPSASGVTAIGDGGTATLNVLEGATLTLGHGPRFGFGVGGSGTLVVAGRAPTAPFAPARLIVNNLGGGAMQVGRNGSGIGGVLLGAQMDVAGSMILGERGAGVGTFSVGILSGTDSARVNIGGDLLIARNEFPTVPSNDATFSVVGGGVADVAGTTYTFDVDGGAGELDVAEGGRFETGSLVMSDPATQLNFSGGLLQVRGGTLDLGGQPLRLNSTTGTPTLELHDNAQAAINSTASPALRIGNDGVANLRVLYGSDLVVHDFDATIGHQSGANGSLTVEHAGSTLTTDQALVVGRGGTGTFTVRGGGQANVNGLRVSTQSTGDGTVVIQNVGTDVHVTDLFELSGLSSGPSNAQGLVRVESGSNLWLDRAGISGDVWPSGDMIVSSGAALRLTGTLVNRGRLTLFGGSTQGGAIHPVEGGVFIGIGEAASTIYSVGDTTGRIITNVATVPQEAGRDGHAPAEASAGTDMILGDPAAPLGFNFLGELQVNPGNVTLQDADSAVVGYVNMNGGTLHGPSPHGIHVALDKRIRGTGTITGAVRPAGRILATGAQGITFTGPVLRTGQGMNGTRFRFASGSSFTGYGRIEANIQVDQGATIQPSFDVTLGGAPIASAVTIDGTLDVAPGLEIDLNGTDSTRVSGLVTMNNGYIDITPTSPLTIRPIGRVRGSGTLAGTTVNAGTIEPGPSTRRLILNQLVMLPSGKIEFQVGNHAAGQLDSISTTTVALNGTLAIESVPGFVPVAGDSFRVISYASRTGTFSTVTVNGGPSAGLVDVVYHASGAWVKVLVNTLDAGGGPFPGAGALAFSCLGSPSRAPAFALELPEAASVTVELFDVSGRRVASLHDGSLPPGRHRFDAETATSGSAGLYFARATVRGARGATVHTARAVRIR